MSAGGILVIGAGVVGRATATVLADGGHPVFGFDPDPAAEALFPGPMLSRAGCERDWEAIVVSVPSPTVDGRMDDRPLRSALELIRDIAPSLESPVVIAIRTTLVPGTMDRVVRPLLEPALTSGAVQACHWPSFARERRGPADERSPRAIVVGRYEGDDHVERFMNEVLAHVPCPVTYVLPVEAELIKHGANLFNSFKISFFNALADWSLERDADGQQVADMVAAVAEGAWNPVYGTRVGPAFGGACLPKDLAALAAHLSEQDSPHLGLLDAVRDINADPRRFPAAGGDER